MINKTTTLREKISELLVKHNLPTRQVAIGELVKLVESEVQEAEKESKKLVEAIHLYNTEPLKALEKARQEAVERVRLSKVTRSFQGYVGYNLAVDDLEAKKQHLKKENDEQKKILPLWFPPI